MPYRVESVDANEMHDETPCFVPEGTFATADAALEGARAVVRRSLEEFAKEGQAPELAVQLYGLYGAIPLIFAEGDEPLEFDPYRYAREWMEIGG